MNIIDTIGNEHLKETVPAFSIGDTVRVDIKVVEGSKERIQTFEGTVIARRGSGVSETFTVRRVSFGVGVEKVFPIHSPRVTDVRVVKKGKVRRAKLHYLRSLSGKSARIKEKIERTAK